MNGAKGLAERLEATLGRELPLLRAIPDGPETTRPNRPSGTGWSRREELGHLVDSAVNNHARFVRAATLGSYSGPGYDQVAWVGIHRYRETPWADLVEIWRAHNAVLVPLVRSIPDERLATPCAVGDAAPVPLGDLIEDYRLHMQHHLDQVLRRPVVTRYPSQGT